MSNVHFSSKSDNWATPDDFFDMIVEKYGPFDVDVCASP
ncbi:MAG: adenine methyltransferase, partial [Proteobacteria bacterium]|nr:adenine methyltransferase [Pseudomonadota bacterium]